MILQAGVSHLIVWTITGLATAGVIIRPLRWPEAIWACAGALALVAFQLLSPDQALKGVIKGVDVYLFLIGMMLLSETARREGLFEYVAALAVAHSHRSPKRLFLLMYGVGAVVTTFLSNDAAAVVLTPAVYAAAKRAKLEPLPYLFICAFIANAASFVLPISNPANIVLYGDHTPALGRWLSSFLLPSAASILVTYGVLRWTEGRRLAESFDCSKDIPILSSGGWSALIGLGLTTLTLLTASAMDVQLGLPTFGMGLLTTAVVLYRKREHPWATISAISWSVLPLVAGLFVMVQALQETGVIAGLATGLVQTVKLAPRTAALGLGVLMGVACNFTNNLPAGLVASSTIAQAHPPQNVIDALLIGIDLGPNISVTGSLATILWLTAIRREGEEVGFWKFLKVGALVTPPSLMLALGARLLFP